MRALSSWREFCSNGDFGGREPSSVNVSGACASSPHVSPYVTFLLIDVGMLLARVRETYVYSAFRCS